MSRQELAGQTVVVIGGSLGIGLETARRARQKCGTPQSRRPRARRSEQRRLRRHHFEQLAEFFDKLPKPIDHILVTGPGPYYAPLAEFEFEKARHDVEAHLFLPLHVARNAVGKVRAGGTLLFMASG